MSGATHEVRIVEIEGKRFIYVELNSQDDVIEFLKAVLAAVDLGLGLYVKSSESPPWPVEELKNIEVRIEKG